MAGVSRSANKTLWVEWASGHPSLQVSFSPSTAWNVNTHLFPGLLILWALPWGRKGVMLQLLPCKSHQEVVLEFPRGSPVGSRWAF